MVKDDLPHQAVAVGMHPRTGQANHPVANPDVLAVEDLLALDDTQAEPRQVILSGLVKLGKDGCLATDQSTLGLDATVTDPLDDLGGQSG